ncbi:MAG: hypothetical protein GXY14_14925 [Spirochaetes bacterium]|nr:hypothetical protein [Spirochaetota bacterium]
MSLDHFIPWSFVVHDRLWNLTPVSRSINSSKSDLLPSLDKYLEHFIDQQLAAYKTALAMGYKGRVLDDYILLGQGMDREGVIRETDFKEMIRNTIVPLHSIALNQGFGLWI